MNIFTKITFLLYLTLLAAPLYAAIYEYTDENGKTYYTDSLEKIPEKYRSKDQGSNVFTETTQETAEEKEAHRQKVKAKQAVAASSYKAQKTKSQLVADPRASIPSSSSSSHRSLKLSNSSSSTSHKPITIKKHTSRPTYQLKGSGY